MRIVRIRWVEENLDHISAHGIESDEVESAVFGRHYQRRARQKDRYEIYGQTEEGRYLFVVLDHEGGGVFYPVTARDMELDERRLYRRYVKK